ncbi:hypothetical protein [Phytoactinopolyspora endophytica]|uniref:hypothetical protein n=1 Tax=Phytoactinopolyspora endophytica TaxID=1642495 RepID=UPI00101BC685|nr:hypothetical protein [Phytoactinopolyspora endophytica]
MFGLVGALVGAAVVGLAWTVLGSGAESSSEGLFDADGADITAPAEVGGYARIADVAVFQGQDGQENLEGAQTRNQRNAKRLSEAYGGAGAVVESYSDDEYDEAFSVKLFRATSPFPPFVAYEDAEELGLARPQSDVEVHGDVACVRHTVQVTPAGEEIDPASVITGSCLRTRSGLTVEITNVTGDLSHDPEKVASLVDEVWSSVS